MKIAYLILAHNTPRHLRRLIAALSSPSSSFFIHLDKKSRADDFVGIEGDVHFTPERIPVFWADFSLVEAALILLRTAFADPRRFDRFVLLSGADYPLRPASYIEGFFAGNPDKEFINLIVMPSEAAKKLISRLTTYQLRPGDPRFSRVIRRTLMRAGVLPDQRDYRVYLGDLIPYGGSEWWALSREACALILGFVGREAGIVNFFKNTICPDESFFQTILGNSPLRSRVARNLTWADWSAGGPNPAYIAEHHLPFLQSCPSFPPDDVYGGGEMLFARKFPDDSEDLVARLNVRIDETAVVRSR